MANTRLQVFYQRGEGDKWTNVYHLEAGGLGAAVAAFVTHMQATLLDMLDPSCRIVKVLASSMTDDTFNEQGIEEVGTHFGSGSLLPLFNCVKVSVNTAGEGRPDVKFLKGFIGEDNQASGVVDPGQLSDLVDAFNAMIGAMDDNATTLQSDEGDAWLVAVGQPAVQMRQMHRRRKKKAAP
jgi:hypothetical protein